MLFLTRKAKPQQDTILIGEDIKIIIRRVDHHDQVRVGIVAPKNINIVREEVLHREQ